MANDNQIDDQPILSYKLSMRWAWAKTYGVKTAIWLPLLALIGIMCVVQFFLYHLTKDRTINIYTFLSQLFSILVLSGFLSGFTKIYIEQARSNPITAGMGFRYFKYFSKVLVILLIFNIATFLYTASRLQPMSEAIKWSIFIIYFLLSHIIYTFFCLSVGLIVDKNAQIGSSLITSFHIVKKVFFKIFMILLTPSLIMFFVLAILLTAMMFFQNLYVMIIAGLLGLTFLIWYIPWCFMLQGMIYYQLVDQNKSFHLQ